MNLLYICGSLSSLGNISFLKLQVIENHLAFKFALVGYVEIIFLFLGFSGQLAKQIIVKFINSNQSKSCSFPLPFIIIYKYVVLLYLRSTIIMSICLGISTFTSLT